MFKLNPEAKAAVLPLIVETGMNQFEVEKRLWKLSFQVPHAHRLQLIMMVLDAQRREQAKND